jgi:putative methanogenesis marker protein 6
VRVTKYVVTSPECTDILPSDISTMIYDSKYNVNVKETCFGVIINGEEDAIESLVKEIRALDPAGIFIKDRGFPVGDPRRCRRSGSNSSRVVSLAFGRRAGGARPGYCMIEAESKVLPLISKALASMAKAMPETPEEVAATAKKQPLDEKRLEEIIRDELS